MVPKYGLILSAKGNVQAASALVCPQLTVRCITLTAPIPHAGVPIAWLMRGWAGAPALSLELMLYAQNLADKDCRTCACSYGATGGFAQVGSGRTIGLTATYMY